MTSGGWRKMLRPLVPMYAGAIRAKERLLVRGWLKQRRLGHPVISVGSLSAGGAGKTPVVVMLAELLGARGYEVRILTRGYGRAGRGEDRVVLGADGTGDARRFGDEPVMMARRLAHLESRAAVWVGADRFRTGRLSEAQERPGTKIVYLLDDGFQHRKLARDVDVVVLTRRELEDELLPVGNLRESLGAMQRADIVVLREDDGFAGGISGRAATWFVTRELRFAGSAPRRVVAFCGLARPEGFFAMVEASGVVVAAVSIFRDHHAYSSRDIERLVELARVHGADGFVTTEKDSVKLSGAMRERLRTVAVAELRVELREAGAKVDELLGMIER